MSTSRLALRVARQSVLTVSQTPCVQRRMLLNSTPTTFQASRGFSRTAVKFEIIKRFTEDHEWISVDTETKIGTIGVTEYAQKALGDVVFVELPELGTEVSAGDAIGAVESVKSASDIMTPVSGNVIEANTALDKKPGLINSSAEGAEGWIARLEVSEAGMGELEGLMDDGKYKEFTTE